MKSCMKFFGMLALVTVLTPLLNNQAKAQTLPFLIVGSGEIPEGLPLGPGDPRPHNSFGFASFVGLHTGQGEFEILANTAPTTADFQSAVPYKFKSLIGNHTLACNYGVVPDAAEPGEVELFPADPEPGTFYAVFIAEFTPALDQCTGKFRRLKGGSFRMLAVSEPFLPTPEGGIPAPDDANGVINYSWVGIGWLKF